MVLAATSSAPPPPSPSPSPSPPPSHYYTGYSSSATATIAATSITSSPSSSSSSHSSSTAAAASPLSLRFSPSSAAASPSSWRARAARPGRGAASNWGQLRPSDDGRIFVRIVKSYCSSNGLRKSRHSPVLVRNEFAGQYEDTFADVDKHLLDYFTYKAVRTVLVQLYEMNPSQYSWFYNFCVENKPQDSKIFLSVLVKERQELCERVMVTRLHLYNKWIKKHDHAKMYQAISDQNLELLRERLVQTVKWPSADGDDEDKS